MRTLQKWKERWRSMPRTWFLQESWWIHTQTPLLYENRRISPYSLSINVIWSCLKWMKWAFILSAQFDILARQDICCHDDNTFLCQWVSAMSSTCLKPPFLARQNICRHGDIEAERNRFCFVISRYGDSLLVFAPFCVSFICSSLDHFFSAQMG